MNPNDQLTLFLPTEVARQSSTIPADMFNLAHTLLNRTESKYVFIPIRSMQYLAVIEMHDIWFVDSQAYAVKKHVGGRMITVSWHTRDEADRESLDQHIPMDIVFYDQDMTEIQLRLRGEFYKAMQLMDERYRNASIPAEGARIIPLKS